MARFVIGSSPIHGHVTPLLRVAAGLVERGHDVVVLTGSRFAGAVEATGANHAPLPPACDYDDRDLDGCFPGRAAKRGPARINFDASRVFADAIPHQFDALQELLGRFSADAILVEPGFNGVLPLLLDSADSRLPVAALNVSALILSSRDTAPFGFGLAPSTRPLGRARNLALRLVIQRVLLGPSQRHFERVLASVGSPKLPLFYMDAFSLADRYMQSTVPSFEYPRRDLPDSVRFVGPMLPPPTTRFEPPAWWGELDGSRPVVHVTQGTVATADLSRLIAPTVAALADDDVLVVVTTAGRPSSAIPGALPTNARVAEFLPYDHLLPKVDVMVTNGGYGGVQYALAHGVPLVVAGATEEKPEIAARVAWAGVGVNMGTGKPTAAKLRTAIRSTLSEMSYRDRARALQKEMERHDAVIEVCTTLEALAETNAQV
jgi:UDP:flavonoid glycosyltransferase YjiC (YdhE family)